jgi:hypothetical protein
LLVAARIAVVQRHDGLRRARGDDFLGERAAPTPLYQEYQNHFGLTPFRLTMIFATYVLCLLLALMTVGSLSDFLGRRPAILSALAMNVAAMIVFMTADSAAALIVARAVQGFATGFLLTQQRTLPRDEPGHMLPYLHVRPLHAHHRQEHH